MDCVQLERGCGVARRAGICRAAGLAALALGLLACIGCQGSNPSVGGPQPRSRAAAGEEAGLPPEADLSNRAPIDQSGGAVEYRQCKLTVPVGALSETVFIEIGIPDEAPQDVLPESAYQINPDGVELLKDGLLAIRYYDEDIPAGRSDEDLMIVHLVNNVWVELSNSKVYVHSNTVEAPVRFLGQYALRLVSDDPRRLNTAPIASFEFSPEPYAAMVGKTPEQAKQDEAAAAAAKEAETEAGAALAPGQGRAGQQGGAAGETETQAEPAPKTDGGRSTQGLIHERYVVAGPGDPPPAPSAREAQQEDTGAGNVAEGAAPPSASTDEQAGTAKSAAPADAAAVTIYFSAAASNDPDGKIVQYDWDFNADGVFDYTSHSSPYAKHTFTHNGDYSVALKVVDNGRYPQSGFATQVVEVRSTKLEATPLEATIAAYPPYGPCPLTVRYAAAVTGGTAPYIYRWKFSDGSESKLPNPSTTYPDADNHPVSFVVTDITGESLSGSINTQSQVPGGPSAAPQRMLLDITPTNSRGYAPFIAKFSLAVERATEPVVYRVSFGDEPLGAEEFATSDSSFTHSYTTAGFYLVKVIATDAELRSASTFATVHAITPESAREFTASEAAVGGDPFSFGHGMHIAFDYVGAQQSGGGRTLRFTPQDTPQPEADLAFQWDFGDGNYSTEMKPQHTFAKDGVYEVRLTATDSLQRFRHRIWLPVSSKQPAAAIQRPAYIEGPAPFSVNFSAIVTRGEQPFKYDWQIGDVRRSDPSAFYTFQLPGEYTVKLAVKDKYDEPIYGPAISVRVRNGGGTYRMPLAVIEPISGSTRAVVLDYTAANPLPLSSTAVEGPVERVDLSADGQYLALAGKDGMLIKRVANGEPVAAFLPAGGELTALAVLEDGNAYCSVATANGPQTYLVTAPCDVQHVGAGQLLDASGDGSTVLLRQKAGEGASPLTLRAVDVEAGQIGEPVALGSAIDARLSRDGRTLYLINAEQRLVRHSVASNTDEYLSGGDDRKSGLAVSGDGGAVAFVSTRGDQRSVIYGREDDAGAFRLASVTDQTGFFSDKLALSADGRYLLTWGSRSELLSLVSAARGQKAEADAVAAEEAAREESVPPTQRRERFGVIRLDLSAAPAEWNITKVDPRFIWEAAAQFANAGPF